MKCLPNTQILIITIVCLFVTLSNKTRVLQKHWLILSHTSITLVFFLQTTSSFRIQWTDFICNSHFVTLNIKKRYSQGLTFHEINTIFCFIKVILKRNWFFFLSTMSDGKKYDDYYGSVPLSWFMPARSLFYPSLLLYRPCECQHSEKGKRCLSIIMTSVMTSWTVWKCLKSPQGPGTAHEVLACFRPLPALVTY